MAIPGNTRQPVTIVIGSAAVQAVFHERLVQQSSKDAPRSIRRLRGLSCGHPGPKCRIDTNRLRSRPLRRTSVVAGERPRSAGLGVDGLFAWPVSARRWTAAAARGYLSSCSHCITCVAASRSDSAPAVVDRLLPTDRAMPRLRWWPVSHLIGRDLARQRRSGATNPVPSSYPSDGEHQRRYAALRRRPR